MKKTILTFSISALLLSTAVHAQRYLTEVFPTVTVTSNIIYGNNISVFPPPNLTAVDLKMDVYEPSGDLATNRPLIIFMHTGSYLPIYLNQTPTGSRNDSATVEICRRFAKRGYVVANMDYRLGWNPQGTSVDIRRGTLLNAVFRSIQDAKACVRYFRKDVAMSGNTYKIDPNKIILGGQGTGGYIALNYECLKDTADIYLPKFISSTTDAQYGLVAGQPYVNMTLLGNYDGYGGIPQLNNEPANSPGYPVDVQFVFNLGGALGDSSWLDAGDAPMVCFHTVGDPFAPFYQGIVYVPGNPPQPVVDVVGSGWIVAHADIVGNNNCFINAGFTDPFTVAANQVNGGVDGLYPFFTNPIIQAGPWEWFDSTVAIAGWQAAGYPLGYADTLWYNSLLTNPDMSKNKAMAYIDTIMGYLNPRVVYCLGLSTGISETGAGDELIKIYPNPVSDRVFISIENSSQTISKIELFDASGKRVRMVDKLKTKNYSISRGRLASGMYLLKVYAGGKEITQKISLQ